ncbi:MAG: hypothetical protein R3C26_08495 [Calditrichia bacterium]
MSLICPVTVSLTHSAVFVNADFQQLLMNLGAVRFRIVKICFDAPVFFGILANLFLNGFGSGIFKIIRFDDPGTVWRAMPVRC